MEQGIEHIRGKEGEDDFLRVFFDDPDLRFNPSGSCCSRKRLPSVLMVQVESALEVDDGKCTKRGNKGG